MFPLDIFKEIIKYIPYSNQGPIRRTCSTIYKIPFTLEQLSEEPTIAEITYSIFDEVKHLSKELYSLTYTNNQFLSVIFTFVHPIKKYKVLQCNSVRSIYNTPKGGEFNSRKHLYSYLRGYTLRYFDVLIVAHYDNTFYELKLCKRILQNRLTKHRIISFCINDTFVLFIKNLLIKVVDLPLRVFTFLKPNKKLIIGSSDNTGNTGNTNDDCSDITKIKDFIKNGTINDLLI